MMSNVVRGNSGGAGLTTGIGGQIGTLVLIQNLFEAGQGLVTGGSNSTPYPSIIEVNNTIYSSQELVLNYGGSILENNIFYNPSGVGVNGPVDGLACADTEASRSPITISHNDIFSPYTTSSGCNVDGTNLAVDPEFLNPSGGDFHTQRTSPVVATGDINAPQIPPTDLDARNRTVCGTIDMGVYEVHPQPATVVTSNNNPSVGGTAVTFTANVPGNCNTPTGTVTFVDGTTPLGTVPLNTSAQASLTTSQLTVGSHNITVTYSGDFNFDPSTSSVLVQVVTGYPTATTLLQVSPNPAQALQTISLSASVSSQFGNPPGTISFYAGSTLLGTAAVNSNGVASTTVNTLVPGTYNITAIYNATTNYASSTSATVVEVVLGADSVTSLTAAPNPAYLGQNVTFSLRVRAAQGTALPMGTVTLTDGGTLLGTATLDASGNASLGVSTLALGSHTITATYSSSGNFNASSASVVELITTIQSSLGLMASPNPAAVGQTVTLTAIASSSTATQVSGGVVTFYDGTTVLGTAPVDATSHSSFSISTLSSGTHNLMAVYSGGSIFGPSTSPVLQESILPSAFTVSLAPSMIALHGGQQGNATVQLTSVGLFAGPLTLSYGALPMYGSASLSPSSVTLATGGTTSSTLSLSTFLKTTSYQPARGSRETPLVLSAGALLLLLPFGRGSGKHGLRLLGLGFALVLLQGLTGCTNSYYTANLVAAGTYNIPITATDSNGNSQTATLTVVVTP
jgi:hypothetical protein